MNLLYDKSGCLMWDGKLFPNHGPNIKCRFVVPFRHFFTDCSRWQRARHQLKAFNVTNVYRVINCDESKISQSIRQNESIRISTLVITYMVEPTSCSSKLHGLIFLHLVVHGNLIVRRTSKSIYTRGPRCPTTSLFLNMSAGTLYLHRFTLFPCYLDNSAINWKRVSSSVLRVSALVTAFRQQQAVAPTP